MQLFYESPLAKILLKASYLTYMIHQALSSDYYNNIINSDNKITLNKLYDWLKDSTKQFNYCIMP